MNQQLPIRIVSKVVRGYGRGSKDLGIPTANISRDHLTCSIGSFDDLPTGIYWGYARIIAGESSSEKDGQETNNNNKISYELSAKVISEELNTDESATTAEYLSSAFECIRDAYTTNDGDGNDKCGAPSPPPEGPLPYLLVSPNGFPW